MTELGLIFGAVTLGFAFAAYLARWVLARPAGEGEMARASERIRAAADQFFRRQSGTIGAVSAVLGGAIFLAYGLVRTPSDRDPVSTLELGVWLTLSFAVGVSGSVVTGRVATWTATRASVRTASGARRSLDQALQIATRAGAVSGLFSSSASLVGIAGLFAAVFAYKGGFGTDPRHAMRLVPTIPWMIAGHALGATFAALLAQLGGGTFAKAADIGADIAGRESGLGEDDRANPATVADLAGDAVGDCAGRSVGLFASTAAENLGAMLVGAALFRGNAQLKGALAFVLFPLVARAFGILAVVFGVMVVRTDDREDPLAALTRGLYVTATLHAVAMAGAAKWLLGAHWLAFLACGVLGIATGLGLLHITQYYTESRFRPVRELAEASRAGTTLTILHGIAVALESCVAPLALIVAATVGAHVIGTRTGLAAGGLFGTAVATLGMLGTAGYVLTMDAFGAIVDASGGIVEMTIARDRPDVRGRTMVLDSVGNTVKTATKAYAGGTAALSSLLLVSTYVAEVHQRAGAAGKPAAPPVLPLDRPEVYVAGLIGVLLVLWLASRCVSGVARAARRVVDEARRQLVGTAVADPRVADEAADAKEARGKDRGTAFVPDHEACVEMASRAALGQMVMPALVCAGVPVAVGVVLRFARTEDNPGLAADAVAALIMAGTIAGVLGSLLLGHAGGAWDNAKKYIATGAHGGRHLVDETGARVDNPTYGAALVADAVGDPLKDTVGPAIHVLVKMLPVVTIVFLPFFI